MMKFLIALFVSVLLSAGAVFSQNDNASLILQSPHGHAVKIMWFFKSWDERFRGFDIKRREGLSQDWVCLNKNVIWPSFLAKHDFRNVGLDKSEAERIRSLAVKYIADHKLPPLDSQQFASKMINDEKFLPLFSKMIADDYDLALISGFAFVDQSNLRKINYEYGLFDHESGNMLAHALWNYGEVPDLNVVSDVTSRSFANKRGILIWWNAEPSRISSGYVHGFNIYRDGIRLNQEPISPTRTEDEGFEWYDSTANSAQPNQYAIASESMLDIEGIIKAYTYLPSEHPSNYQKARVDNVASLGLYFKEGVRVIWDFPIDYEKYILGFYLEKENIPGGYKRVSPLLPPSFRDYTDRSKSSVSSYIRFRVITVYKDRLSVPGPDRVYSYFPLREPPAPLDLSWSGVVKNKSYLLTIKWNLPMSGDSITDYYRLFRYNNVDGRFDRVADAGKIKTNYYNYLCSEEQAGENRFCLSAVGKNGAESKMSDTLTVLIPTADPPKPAGLMVAPADKNLVIQWQYGELFDLKGFRLFVNNKLVAGEDSLTKNTRECPLVLPHGHKYEFKIQAVTTSDVTSELSEPAGINLPESARKER